MSGCGLMSTNFSVDIVLPTVRADASTVRRVVELPIPPAFAGLKILVVVDGPQTEAAWLALHALAAENSSVTLLCTRPNHHGWPAGASAARNTGIDHSSADWVLFLDDDTTPAPDLLYEYYAAMEHRLGPNAPTDVLPPFGFAGVTAFVAAEASLWAVVARCSGMLDAFTSASRAAHPPWSPTANLMLRRATFEPDAASHSGAPAAPPAAATASSAAASTASAPGPRADAVAADEPSEHDAECARLLPDAGPSPPAQHHRHPMSAEAAASAASASSSESSALRVSVAASRLSWCRFDETLPRNGGAEDVEI